MGGGGGGGSSSHSQASHDPKGARGATLQALLSVPAPRIGGGRLLSLLSSSLPTLNALGLGRWSRTHSAALAAAAAAACPCSLSARRRACCATVRNGLPALPGGGSDGGGPHWPGAGGVVAIGMAAGGT